MRKLRLEGSENLQIPLNGTKTTYLNFFGYTQTVSQKIQQLARSRGGRPSMDLDDITAPPGSAFGLLRRLVD